MESADLGGSMVLYSLSDQPLSLLLFFFSSSRALRRAILNAPWYGSHAPGSSRFIFCRGSCASSGSPLPEGQRSDRIARCDPGEGPFCEPNARRDPSPEACAALRLRPLPF